MYNKSTITLRAFCMNAVLAMGISLSGQAQMKMGNNPTTVNANAVLELETTNKGLLLPRIALTGTNLTAPLSAHVAGMSVYNTATAGTPPYNVTPGYYYNDGAQWLKITSEECAANSYSVINELNTPPGVPNDEDVYLVGTSPSVLWAGKAKQIATWDADLAAWTFVAPGECDNAFNITTNVTKKYNSATWTTINVTPAAYWKLVGNQIVSLGQNKLGSTNSFPVSFIVRNSEIFNIDNLSYGFNGGYRSQTGTAPTRSFAWGKQDTVTGLYSGILGAFKSKVTATYSGIIGGQSNLVTGGSSVVAGGISNTVSNSYSAIVAGEGNAVTGGRSAVIGGQGDTVIGAYSVIIGGRSNYLSANQAAIAGGTSNKIANTAAYGGTLGGQSNYVSGQWAVVAGGATDSATGNASAVLGGGVNKASGVNAAVVGGGYNTASGNYSFATGWSNTASGGYAVVDGGYNNTVSNSYSGILAGKDNAVTNSHSAVIAGLADTVTNSYSVILGGSSNYLSGSQSIIAGGQNNYVANSYAANVGGINNYVNGQSAVIAGGSTDSATGTNSAVLGGGNNNASAIYSAVVGGRYNKALGDYSFATGYQNTASGANSFAAGYQNTASGDYSVATGYLNKASGDQAVTIGYFNTANATTTYAYGSGLASNAWGSIALGINNDTAASPSKTTWVGTDPLLIIGNGANVVARKNAFIILKNGWTIINAGTTGGYLVPRAELDVRGTGAMIVPVGTTAQRPATAVQGMIRYNTNLSKFEGYDGAAWQLLN